MEGSSGNGGLIGLLIVNVIGFLTIVVTSIATSMKASAERKQAADALQLQLAAQRDALLTAAKIEADKTAADREWQREERRLQAATTATAHAAIESRIETVAKKADAAWAVTTGIGLPDEPKVKGAQPVLSKRLKALAAAGALEFPKLIVTQIGAEAADLAVTELFAPGHEPLDHEVSVIDAGVELEERIDVGPLVIKPLPEKK